MTVAGAPAEAKTMNIEGLKRRGFAKQEIATLQQAFKILYRKHLLLDTALEQLETLALQYPSIQLLIDSVRQSTRGIVR